jgi:hypothetical protein
MTAGSGTEVMTAETFSHVRFPAGASLGPGETALGVPRSFVLMIGLDIHVFQHTQSVFGKNDR